MRRVPRRVRYQQDDRLCLYAFRIGMVAVVPTGNAGVTAGIVDRLVLEHGEMMTMMMSRSSALTSPVLAR